MAVELLESEEQVVAINNGNGQAERIAVDLHDPLEPAYKVKAVLPYVVELTPTEKGLQADVTAIRGSRHEIVDRVATVQLQPDMPFIVAFDKPMVIGDQSFGVMRSMAKVVRSTPDEHETELEPVNDFEFDELHGLRRLIVDYGNRKRLRLKLSEEEARAELEYQERGVVYRKVQLPVVDLGKRVKKGMEDNKLKTVTAGLGLSAVGLVMGLYLSHKSGKD